MNVKVIHECYPTDLENQINTHLRDGYQLYGNLLITLNGWYVQLMLKG